MAFALGLVTSWSFDDHDSSNGCQLGIKSQGKLGAAIAQWIRLRLPSCRPGFESRACPLRFFI